MKYLITKEDKMNYLITFLTCITISMAAEGKIGVLTYFDYTNSEGESAFNFERQYFSYAGVASDNIDFKIIFDVGRTGKDTRLAAFLKKAQIDYKTSYGNVSMGLIGMNTHSVQEKNWGNRFIEKSAMDKNKYSTSADLGIGFSRLLREYLTISLQIVNGEVYQKPQGDKYHKITFNATYGEQKLNKNDGYNAGLVYSNESTDSDPTNMISAFGGFSGLGLRLGVEYDLLTESDVESNIISVSANYDLKDDMDVFVRYDIYDPDTKAKNDGDNYLIAGIILNCGSGLSVAPNVRITTYEDTDKEISDEYKINLQFKF